MEKPNEINWEKRRYQLTKEIFLSMLHKSGYNFLAAEKDFSKASIECAKTFINTYRKTLY